jgi:probable rRNA maturation factor
MNDELRTTNENFKLFVLYSSFIIHHLSLIVSLVLNRQKHYALNLPALRAYIRGVKRALRLGRRDFNVCLVSDLEIRRLNLAFRGVRRPTDVLSFPWQDESKRGVGEGSALPRRKTGSPRAPLPQQAALGNFLGDVVISVETARRNAHVEGHSTLNEIRWLVLHGVLHLLGYDHERDHGEMTQLEYLLREKLGLTDSGRKRQSKKKFNLAVPSNHWARGAGVSGSCRPIPRDSKNS